MPITSRQGLADYALRSLGAPVLNIEIDDEQIDDAVETAILFFKEYHPDGIFRDYLKHKITGTVLTLDNASLITKSMIVISGNIAVTVQSVTGNTIVISKQLGDARLAIGNIITFPGGTATIISIVLGDVDNEWLPMDEGIVGISKIIPFAGYSDGLFDITYQLRMNDLRNLHTGTMAYFNASMSYLGLLDFMLRKEKQFRFNRRMNRLYLDINWKDDMQVDTYLVVEVQTAIDDSVFTGILNDIWLKKLVCAEMKKYWGSNLRKYNGVQLLGGVTLDGERILSEAVGEIAVIEQEIINNQAPLEFQLG